MAPKKVSPNRRRSIAVPNQNLPSLVPKGRRRAHSIVPGATLSPLAKARRSLAPRKSILKASINTLNVDSSSQPTNQQPSSTGDDSSITRSMDITHDNTTRKSLGRRVSFAAHSHVRMFETNNTNESSTPSSDPASPEPSQAQNISNENDYPGQTSRRRRSSIRYSVAGSEDMDITAVIPGGMAARGTAILDEEFDYEEDEDYEDADMDVTEAIRGDFARKHSLSIAGRRPLSQLQSPSQQQFNEADETRSDNANESFQSEATSEQSEQSMAMEFTIPLGQSLKPAEKDEAWLALKQMTHSGNNPSEPELSSEDEMTQEGDMNLDDAMERLRRARDSLPASQKAEQQASHGQDDTFTSTEDSLDMDDNPEEGNKTLNLSVVMGRASLARNSRISLGYQDSNMDESEIYGDIVAPVSRDSLVPQSSSSSSENVTGKLTLSSVFQPPRQDPKPKPSIEISAPSAKPSVPFSFTPRAPSPTKSSDASKLKPKPTFSAAFAPPVARKSPKKVATSPSPAVKRTRSSPQDENDIYECDQPSPAKRQALTKDLSTVTSQSSKNSSSLPSSSATEADSSQLLSPIKKGSFSTSTAAAEPPSRPSTALRRPSGYFAKRKSLAVGFEQSSTTKDFLNTGNSSQNSSTHARASMGSAPPDAWTRFNREVGFDAAKVVGTSNVVSIDRIAEAGDVRQEDVEQPNTTHSAQSSPGSIQSTAVIESRDPSPEIQNNPALVVPNMETQFPIPKMQIDRDSTQHWREGVEQTEYEEENEEVPSISVTQFFAMTGVKFMDELTAPRRSMHPSQQPIRQPRNTTEIPLAEYFTAMAIDIPQLDLYSRVSKDLEGWMEKSKAVFAQTEEEAAKVTPELFVEYARADEEGQAELLQQLNLIRTHTRFLARSDWYDWKLQWVEGLRMTAESAFTSLENDARALEGPKKVITSIIPALEKEYEDIMRELEKEQTEVAEIEDCDQDYLNELKATIAEQNIEIESLKAELAEGNDQVRWLQERLEEIDTQTQEAKQTISTAERVLRMKQTSTRAEVFRLKGELEALEDLHRCRITKVNSNLFEYVYSSLFQVSIPCKNFVPIVKKVTITRHGKPETRYKDDYPQLSSFLLNCAKRLIVEGDDMTVREIVQRLADYWSSCARLRLQLTLLNVKFPLEISVQHGDSTPPQFKASVMVMFPSVKAKAVVSFLFSFDTISRWPMAIDSLDCDVEVSYGPIDRSAILTALSSRLSQASPMDNFACLLDACIEAQDVYH
ncbi:Kinetochore protein spc7 [Psilocybe cubensis]|uniref:Kinetochore protein spc7 n=2 Tax=Psilocybe cubensis TaxID=181762 RepID=A0ACB8HIA1_PSICU|nr:Kinetochore protein spc7 [Psilocybe cubensis]KAH9487055.1 Kinetochore protein spc7 [Psilocybe cubensis]